jgi:hypothetical protein
MLLPSCLQFISRMMGLNEEPGIIPRFCEDLFAQIAKKQTSEVCSNSVTVVTTQTHRKV